MNRFTSNLQTTCFKHGLKSSGLKTTFQTTSTRHTFPSSHQSHSRFHSSRKQHSTEPPQQPQQSQQSQQPLEPTEPISTQSLPPAPPQQPPQQPVRHLTPDDILYHDPRRVRTEADNVPGLRKLDFVHPEQFAQNAKFLASGSIYSNNIPSAHNMGTGAHQGANLAYEMTRGMPNLANLNQQSGMEMGLKPKSRSTLPSFKQQVLTPEEKSAKHQRNFKKLAMLSICIGVVMMTMNNYYAKKGAMKNANAAAAQAEIDYTTKTISNENHSVSPLAEEIIEDMIRELKTPEDHKKYIETQTLFPPIFQPANAMKVPLFVAKNPTKLQTKYNQIRHEQEMVKIYSTPPLNNKNVELYLTDLEKMNRDYRLSHDERYVMDAAKNKSRQGLGDRIGFELQLRGKLD